MTMKELEMRCTGIAEQMNALAAEALKTCPELANRPETGATISIFADADNYAHIAVYMTYTDKPAKDCVGTTILDMFHADSGWSMDVPTPSTLCEWGGKANDDR